MGDPRKRLLAIVAVIVAFPAVGTFAFPTTVLVARAAPVSIRATVLVPVEPLNTQKLEDEREIEATGRMKRARATGTARFGCCISTILDFAYAFAGAPEYPDRITIPAGTLVWSCASTTAKGACGRRGRVFRTTRADTISTKHSVPGFFSSQRASEEVPVVAVRSGSAWNNAHIAGSSVTAAQGTPIEVVSAKRPTGGANGGELYVSRADMLRTRDEAVSDLDSKAFLALSTEAERRGLMLTGYTKARASKRFSLRTWIFGRGRPAMKVKLTARAYGYREKEFDEQATPAIRRKLPAGYRLAESEPEVTWAGLLPDGRRARLIVIVKALLSDVSMLERLTEGANAETASETIRRTYGGRVSIERRYRPFGFIGDRLKVEVAGGARKK